MEDFKQTMIRLGWGSETLELAIRAKFKCEYCDSDILESVNSYYDIQVEHIIPKQKGGSNESENLAISCKTCNFIKKYFDARDLFPNEKPTREQLINVSREYIKEYKQKKFSDIIVMKEISKKILNEEK